MRSRRDRSQFDSLSDTHRSNLYEAAKTQAQQGLRFPASTAANKPPHKPGNQGGTYNGKGTGSTMAASSGGVELMNRLAHQRAGIPAPRVPRSRPRGWSFGRRAINSKPMRWPTSATKA